MPLADPSNPSSEKRDISRMLLLGAAALILALNLALILRLDLADTTLLPEPCAQGSLRGSLGCLAAISEDAAFDHTPRPGVGQDELVVGPQYEGHTGGSPHDSLHTLVQGQSRGEARNVKGKEGHSDAAAPSENNAQKQGHRPGPARPSGSNASTATGSALTQQKGNVTMKEGGTAPRGGMGESKKRGDGRPDSSTTHASKGNQSPHSPGVARSNAHVAKQAKPQATNRSEDRLTSAVPLPVGKGDSTEVVEKPKAAQATAANKSQAKRDGSSPREYLQRAALSLPGHEGDAPKVRELAAIMQHIARNDTVVVIPTNAGYLDMALNVRCRLLDLNATNFMIWALDDQAAADFQRQNISNFYYDPTLFSVKNVTGYYDADYIRMMSERPKVWWRMLATGFDIMFVDADVVVFDPPEVMFARRGDVEGQVDGWGWAFERNFSNVPALCAGAFWMRSSLASLDFMDRVIHTFDKRLKKADRWDDQLALNWILHNKSHAVIANRGSGDEGGANETSHGAKRLVMHFSDPTKILPGHLWWGTQLVGDGYNTTFSVQVDPTESTLFFRPSLFHLSGHGEKWKKVKTLQAHGWWELSNTLQCRRTILHDA